jgi:hypothetical protein
MHEAYIHIYIYIYVQRPAEFLVLHTQYLALEGGGGGGGGNRVGRKKKKFHKCTKTKKPVRYEIYDVPGRVPPWHIQYT